MSTTQEIDLKLQLRNRQGKNLVFESFLRVIFGKALVCIKAPNI